jgi:hypothetical protein
MTASRTTPADNSGFGAIAADEYILIDSYPYQLQSGADRFLTK